MSNVELTTEQIEQELTELTEEGEAEDTKSKSKTKVKEVFVPLLKEEIEKLSRREQFEYKIALSKHRTEELKNEYQGYKQRESKTSRSQENKRLIIMGRFLETQLHKRPDRKIQYMVVNSHLDQYLTKNSDRELLGFPLLATSNRNNSDNN